MGKGGLMEDSTRQQVAFQLGRVEYWGGDISKKGMTSKEIIKKECCGISRGITSYFPGIPSDLELRLSTMDGTAVNFLDGIACEAIEYGGKNGIDDAIKMHILMENIGKLDSTRSHNLKSLYYQGAKIMLGDDSNILRKLPEIVSYLEKAGLEKEKIDEILLKRINLNAFLYSAYKDEFYFCITAYVGKEKIRDKVIKTINDHVKESYHVHDAIKNLIKSKYLLNSTGMDFNGLPEELKASLTSRLDKIIASENLKIDELCEIREERLYEFTGREFINDKTKDAANELLARQSRYFSKSRYDKELSETYEKLCKIIGEGNLVVDKIKLINGFYIFLKEDYSKPRHKLRHTKIDYLYEDLLSAIKDIKSLGAHDSKMNELGDLLGSALEKRKPSEYMTWKHRRQIKKLIKSMTKNIELPKCYGGGK